MKAKFHNMEQGLGGLKRTGLPGLALRGLSKNKGESDSRAGSRGTDTGSRAQSRAHSGASSRGS
jgi:hypothetical protein